MQSHVKDIYFICQCGFFANLYFPIQSDRQAGLLSFAVTAGQNNPPHASQEVINGGTDAAHHTLPRAAGGPRCQRASLVEARRKCPSQTCSSNESDACYKMFH